MAHHSNRHSEMCEHLPALEACDLPPGDRTRGPCPLSMHWQGQGQPDGGRQGSCSRSASEARVPGLRVSSVKPGGLAKDPFCSVNRGFFSHRKWRSRLEFVFWGREKAGTSGLLPTSLGVAVILISKAGPERAGRASPHTAVQPVKVALA